jgi:sugar/nucleoside kinase (ribokinase family)
VGKHGDDPGGTLVRELFGAYGVEVLGPHAHAANGTVVSLVSPGGDRTMCSDRGVAPTLTLDEIDPAWLADVDHLHVSGYALFAEPIRDAALGAIALAQSNGARVSVDLSSWSLIRDARPDDARRLVERAAPDVVFANEQEAATIGGPTDGSTWIVKRGARGCSFGGEERPSVAVEHVVDTTGAGDALAAGWIVGGPDLALAAAARCIGQAGAMP